MTTLQTDSVPSPEEELIETRAPSSAPSSSNRVIVSLAVIGVVGLVLIALAQTVGQDLLVHARRWSRVRKAAPPALSESTATADAAAGDSVAFRQLRHVSNSNAADAQISPPRRKTTPTSGPAAAPTPVDAAGQATVEPLANDPNRQAAIAANAIDLPVGLPTGIDIPTGPAMNGAPHVPATDPTEELLDTAAQLVSLSWQDFEYPVGWLAAETSKPRMIYAGHRNRLLKAIAHTRPSALSLEFARKDYAVACEQFRDDPRLDYAFGLTLWKHGQFSEATDMFQTAARLEGVPFLPAALAVAWGRFQNHEERRGLDQLAHIARLLSVADAYPTEQQKEQAATSIGRALGYLSGPGRIPELDETLQLTTFNILKRLPDKLRDACEKGREQVGQRQSELFQVTARPVDQIQSAHQSRQAELQSQIDDLRDEMEDASNELSRGHRTHLETVSKALKEALDVRVQMEKLQSYVKQLQETRAKLAKPKPNIVTKPLPEHYSIVSNGNSSSLVRQNATTSFLLQEKTADRAGRISKLTKVREDLKKISTDLADLKSRQADLVLRRREADLQQNLDKGEAREERVARLNEQRELKLKLQELNKALRRTMTLREGLDTIAAYIPWNVEVEGEALWTALTAKPRQ